ncbi:peptide deformylase [Candidatus Curtissbacteria bacterium]|nr:peptide deformylase [Candidatus Curtissbacteria bacterium]
MKIFQEPDKRLHLVSSTVKNFDEAKKITQELVEVTRGLDRPYKLWIGMAAVQIGYKKRIILYKKGILRLRLRRVRNYSIHPRVKTRGTLEQL